MPSSKRITNAELAYVAALIDLQGHITSRTVREAVLPMVALSSPNAAVLRLLGEMTGVRPFITRRDYSRLGCVAHCPEPHQHIVSESGRWSLSGVKATVVLHSVLPFLRFQRDEAIEAIRLGLEAGYKPATIAKMAELGWRLPNFPDRKLSR